MTEVDSQSKQNELLANVKFSASAATDEDLVAAAKSGDHPAFVELWTRQSKIAFNMAYRITGNQDDAEDAIQDAWMKAYTHLNTFDGRAKFSTWLTRIAINQALMKLRTRRRRELQRVYPDTPEEIQFCAEVADDTPTPEQQYSQKELQRILASAMEELPLASREVLQLREVEERSTVEAARILGLSIPAVKSRMLRGRQKLRQALTKHF